jgi:arabinosaccharide transport system permease protein
MRNGLNFSIDWKNANLDEYRYLFSGNNAYFTWYINSLIVTVVQVALALILSSWVGYGFAMYEFKGKNLSFMLVLLVMMVPTEVIILPLYRLIIRLGLINTKAGIIVPYVVIPMLIFFFRQYVLGLPKELLEAARIDGCSDYGVFFRIMVPNMIPAYGAMTILSCMNSWNNLLWPLIVLNTNEKFTIPIGMGTTITPYGNAFDVLMPGAVMAVVPIIIVYLFAQKTFIAGLTSGSVKG